MVCRARRSGFTLIEVLIVVVIMAILAATVIPQLSSATADAKESTLRFNLHTLRGQIANYKVQHGDSPPTGANNLEQLLKVTNAAGDAGGTGPDYTFGPYVLALPVNPFKALASVKLDTGAAVPAPDDSYGYIYRAATGQIWAANSGTPAGGGTYQEF